MVKNNKNKNSSNSLGFGLWPQTKTRAYILPGPHGSLAKAQLGLLANFFQSLFLKLTFQYQGGGTVAEWSKALLVRNKINEIKKISEGLNQGRLGLQLNARPLELPPDHF